MFPILIVLSVSTVRKNIKLITHHVHSESIGSTGIGTIRNHKSFKISEPTQFIQL